jgi:hypothetical protein
LAAIARIAGYGGRQFEQETALRTLIAKHESRGRWPYSLGFQRRENDLEHHSFLIEGAHWVRMPHATDAFSRLGSFFRSDGGFDQLDVDVMGSHSWNPEELAFRRHQGERECRLRQRVGELRARGFGRM